MPIYLFIYSTTLLRTIYVSSTMPGARDKRQIDKTSSGSRKMLKNQEEYLGQGIMSILRIKFDKREDLFLRIYV